MPSPGIRDACWAPPSLPRWSPRSHSRAGWPAPELEHAVRSGVLVGFGFVVMGLAITYAFAGRCFKLWLVDGGYHPMQFALYGPALGAWH